MRALFAILLLLVVCPAPADIYYLLSKVREQEQSLPLPYSPHPRSPTHHVVDNIWLVDDLGTNTAAEVNQAVRHLEFCIDEARAMAALVKPSNPETNAPVSPRPPQPRVSVSRGPTSAFYGKPELYNLVVRRSPWMATNISAIEMDLITNPVYRIRDESTENFLKRAKVVPAHIVRGEPGWEEKLRQWLEEEKAKDQAAREKASAPTEQPANDAKMNDKR